jgi:nucleoside 2-deoxyribosyltransferase
MENWPDICILCKHPESKKFLIHKAMFAAYSCPRCGKYYISELMVRIQPGLFDGGNFRLACVAYEWRHRQGESAVGFVLTDDGATTTSTHTAFPECRIFQLEEMRGAFPKGSEIVERAMLNLSRMVEHQVDSIGWTHSDLPYALFTSPENKMEMLGDLQGIGYVKIKTLTVGSQSAPTAIRLTPLGWQQIEKWSGRDLLVDSKQAFVAMWFAPEMDPVLKEGIEPAVRDAKYDPKRIDLVEHNNKICDVIVAEIRKSRFVVADFTGQRGGVYFEAGFAMGLGIPVIWTVRKDQVEQVHFDTRQYNHIVYETPEELKSKLYNRIVATIR